MDFEIIRFEVKNNVGRIILNRPDVMNSFNIPMAKEVQRALDQCRDDKSIGAVYLTGEGKGFCAGQDLEEATQHEAPDIAEIVRTTYSPIIQRVRKLEKPVICGVNGTAAGAGANIAYACDITLAVASAKFIQSFSNIGLIPDSGGTYFLPRLVGHQKAMAMTMLGEKVTAEEAADLGLIYKACSDEEMEGEALKIAEKLAKMPTRGLGLTKKAINKGMNNTLEDQLGVEEELQAEAGKTKDFKEGVQAFLEKRKPEFKGE